MDRARQVLLCVKADEITIMVAEIKAKVKNWQAIAWLLERCFREDFGADAGVIQILLEKAEKMEQSLKRLEINPLQGAINHG